MCEKMATIAGNERVGNTKATRCRCSFEKKGKNFLLTLWDEAIEHEQEIIKYLEHFKEFIYILICEHEPDETIPHIHHHLYVQFTNAVKLNTKHMWYAHTDTCKGSAQANIEYCKGLDDKHKEQGVKSTLIYENGEAKMRGGISLRQEVITMTDKQIEKNVNPHLIRIAKDMIVTECKRQHFINMFEEKIPTTIWVTGNSGAGKTRHTLYYLRKTTDYKNEVAFVHFDEDGKAEIEQIGNPLNIKYLVLNEFRDSCMSFRKFLTTLLNEAPFRVLYGNVYFPNIEKIIITSRQEPKEIYKNVTEDRYQIERRISKVIFYEGEYDLINHKIESKRVYNNKQYWDMVKGAYE